MFNAYQAHRIEESIQHNISQHRKIQEWRVRYKTQVRPYLIDRYRRRINGFAKKMQDEPYKVNNDKLRDEQLEQMAKRKFDETLNITKTRWRIRREDWSSWTDQIGRNSIINKWSDEKKKKQSRAYRFQSLKSLDSDEKYEKIKVEYRSRNKSKQINPPMKYSSPIFPKLSTPKQSKLNTSTQAIHQRLTQLNQSTIEGDPESIDTASVSQGMDIDLLQYSTSVKKLDREKQKSEREVMEEEEMKALVQNKLYFKSLIDLERSVATIKERNGLKEILVKCGIYRPTMGKVAVEEDDDHFLEMMKTKQ